MALVALARCGTYSYDELTGVIEESLAHIGFPVERFRGARVAVKPNLLTIAREEQAVITHPEFFRGVVRLVKAQGGTPVLVESPAILSLERVIKKTGYAAMLEAETIEIADPTVVQTLHYEDAKRFKHLDISKAYCEADMILGLPKFKTHGITAISGAVKNLFGAMPGLEKSKMHLRLPDHREFAAFLLDLYGALLQGFDPPKPMLHIMDAILALEGEGPGQGGTPRQMNAVLASEDALALDWAATQLAGLDHQTVPTLVQGFQREFDVASPEAIHTAGATVTDLRVGDFVPAKGNSLFSNAFRWPLNSKTFKNLFVERPVPIPETCSLCYQCQKICPAGAIGRASHKASVPLYDYNACIRCYCCLEICPEGAIKKQQGRLQWLLKLLER